MKSPFCCYAPDNGYKAAVIHEQCQARTKVGGPCGAAATSGGLCFFHANPARANQLGGLGGMKKSRGTQESELLPLPSPTTVASVRDAIARIVDALYVGRIDPKVALAITPLLDLQLQVIEMSDLTEQIARLESKVTGFGNDDAGIGGFTPQ